jgi:hypothetical protein
MSGFDDTEAYQAKCDANYAEQQANLTPYGALRGMTSEEHEKSMRDQRVQSAIWSLTEARRIRSDPALMAEIRAWVAEKRCEFMQLMDDLGS